MGKPRKASEGGMKKAGEGVKTASGLSRERKTKADGSK